MNCPKAVMFDLDDTLAESFKSPTPEVLEGLRQLLSYIPVAIITGAGFKRMEEQFLEQLVSSPHSDRLYLFPGSSAQAYTCRSGTCVQLYSLSLTLDEREKIKTAILQTIAEHDEFKKIQPRGQQMFDREEQVAYTVVGFDAPLELKQGWDPTGTKRQELKCQLEEKLPEFEVLLGGATTIDITRKGINKSYGVKWFAEHLKIAVQEMLYVGDALFEGGNDAVVIPTGIPTRAVASSQETPAIIVELLTACSQ